MTLRAFGPIVVALAVLIAVSGAAVAGRSPEATFRGQILTSKKRFPTSDKSAAAYISKLKGQKTDRFLEDKATKTWKIHYAAFFKHALNDLEVTVRLYDLSKGGKTLLNSFEQYLDTRGATSVISNFTLERGYVGVNKQVLITVESKGAILASGKFWILGEGEKFSGEANFSEDEAKNGTQ
jgi:hypothetical protein